MNIMQYQILMSTKGITTENGKGKLNGYTIYQDKNGDAVIEGKLTFSMMRKIIESLPKESPFVKTYKNISIMDFTSDDFEAKKQEWFKKFDVYTYREKVEAELGKLQNETAKEELWYMLGFIRCADVESFSIAIDVAKAKKQP